jgi:tRNA modification GTPase
VLALSARVEALLDHSDEDDVAGEPCEAIAAEALAVADEIDAVLRRPPVERLHDGLRVVLAGPPNAGKSTLLNALIGRDAAIVSPIAGTTRDRIEAPVVRGGVAYVLTDTAGLAERPGDAIEEIGIARARAALAEADIILWLGDTAPPPPAIWVHSRADAPGRGAAPADALPVSGVTGAGLDRLWHRVGEQAKDLLPPPDLVALNRRQRDLCTSAAGALIATYAETDPLLLAEHLRSALRAFDSITGRAGVEAMLDALFARFCIGK